MKIKPNNIRKSIKSKTNRYLKLAQELYGYGDSSVNIAKIELIAENTPEMVKDSNNNCSIYLTKACVNNNKELEFELAHELIHKLRPCFRDEVTILEEGMCVYFQLKEADYKPMLSNIESQLDGLRNDNKSNYIEAYNLFKPIIERSPDFIKNLQEGINKFCELTPQQIMEQDSNITENDAKSLLEKFKY